MISAVYIDYLYQNPLKRINVDGTSSLRIFDAIKYCIPVERFWYIIWQQCHCIVLVRLLSAIIRFWSFLFYNIDSKKWIKGIPYWEMMISKRPFTSCDVRQVLMVCLCVKTLIFDSISVPSRIMLQFKPFITWSNRIIRLTKYSLYQVSKLNYIRCFISDSWFPCFSNFYWFVSGSIVPTTQSINV